MDTVNDPGFRSMLKEFEPRYQLPDRKTITCNYLPAMFVKSQTSHFAITTDAWTSGANHAYVTLTIHYIDDQYSLLSHVLETSEFHTARNIADGLEDSLSEWGLSEENLVGVTTDNVANIVAAIYLLNWPNHHFPCYSHTLQLGVHKAMALSCIEKALARCKRFEGHF